jgi:RNA polymerase sigma-70 factor (ECF subfamily)
MAQPLNNVASAKNEVSEWVNLYSDDLYAYAVKRVSDQNLAQDLVQNAFIAAYQSFDRFEGKSKPKTWLISILKNKIMDHFRQVYRRNETLIEGEEQWFDQDGNWKKEMKPEPWNERHLLDDPTFVTVFDGCIEALPEKWETSVRIKYLASDVSLDELGVSKANYWKMLERARTRLRDCLEVNWFKANA